jgi:hypothetical protein
MQHLTTRAGTAHRRLRDRSLRKYGWYSGKGMKLFSCTKCLFWRWGPYSLYLVATKTLSLKAEIPFPLLQNCVTGWPNPIVSKHSHDRPYVQCWEVQENLGLHSDTASGAKRKNPHLQRRKNLKIRNYNFPNNVHVINLINQNLCPTKIREDKIQRGFQHHLNDEVHTRYI